MVAFGLGFLAASTTSYGYAKLDAWRGWGDWFQLGYVVGFLDANTLRKYRDRRGALVPAGGQPNYYLWREKVNEFYADPKNAKRDIVDAMDAVGAQLSRERLKKMGERTDARSSPRPSP